jgi:uncharacterized protein YjiS (DUF1127 family)
MNGTYCQAASLVPTVALPRRQRNPIASTLLSAVESLLAWRDRARSRRALLAMDDRLLNDIGIDRATAQVEGERPFWKA